MTTDDQPTPGPWRFSGRDNGIMDAHGETIATFMSGARPTYEDALLMSRAPDLQAEVERLRGLLGQAQPCVRDLATMYRSSGDPQGLDLAEQVAGLEDAIGYELGKGCG